MQKVCRKKQSCHHASEAATSRVTHVQYMTSLFLQVLRAQSPLKAMKLLAMLILLLGLGLAQAGTRIRVKQKQPEPSDDDLDAEQDDIRQRLAIEAEREAQLQLCISVPRGASGSGGPTLAEKLAVAEAEAVLCHSSRANTTPLSTRRPKPCSSKVCLSSEEGALLRHLQCHQKRRARAQAPYQKPSVAKADS